VLVLSRRRGESLIIAEGEIVVTVVEVRSDGSVRLGVTAPRDIPVWREEVYEAIERERKL
jgi:carbon storage regulator